MSGITTHVLDTAAGRPAAGGPGAADAATGVSAQVAPRSAQLEATSAPCTAIACAAYSMPHAMPSLP